MISANHIDSERSATDVPLADAAIIWKEAWNRAWKRLLVGEVRGEKRNGRWYINRDDVERVRKDIELRRVPTGGGCVMADNNDVRPLPRPALPEEVMHALALSSVKEVRRRAADGQIPGAFKCGRVWRFNRAELEQFIAGKHAA